MSLTTTIRDTLAADAPLSALLVGGIYTFAQTGRNGISRVTTPDAFDGFLQPCAVVRAPSSAPADPIRDSAAALNWRIEIHLYDDGDAGFTTLNTARDAIVALLDHQWISGAGFLRHIGGANDGRDPKLNGAALVRLDFTATA